MTCFWDGIISSLTNEDFKKINISDRPSPEIFIINLKKMNTKTDNVIWCNKEITSQQKEENYTAINNLDIKNISSGYFCSTFDPFLFLISELFYLDIHHSYLGNNINYKNINSIKNVYYTSDTGHFKYISTKIESKPSVEEIIDIKVEEKVEEIIDIKVEEKVERKIDVQIEEKVERKIDAQIKTKVDIEIEEKVDIEIEEKVDLEIEEKVDVEIEEKEYIKNKIISSTNIKYIYITIFFVFIIFIFSKKKKYKKKRYNVNKKKLINNKKI